MIRYKLTDAEGRTKGGMEWAVGVTNRATGAGRKLCSDGYLHVYDTPEQAVFMRPAHVRSYTRLWEVECPDEGVSDGTKRGVKEATVLREIPLPEVTDEQRVEVGIRCAMLVYKGEAWLKWARGWLDGTDRSSAAANAAATADAAYAANAANAAAAADAAYAANAAAYADAAYAANAAAAADAAALLDLCGIITSVMGRQA